MGLWEKLDDRQSTRTRTRRAGLNQTRDLVYTDRCATPSGIRVGDEVEVVLATYPGIEVTHHALNEGFAEAATDGQYLIHAAADQEAPDRRLLFGVIDGEVASIRAGLPE